MPNFDAARADSLAFLSIMPKGSAAVIWTRIDRDAGTGRICETCAIRLEVPLDQERTAVGILAAALGSPSWDGDRLQGTTGGGVPIALRVFMERDAEAAAAELFAMAFGGEK